MSIDDYMFDFCAMETKKKNCGYCIIQFSLLASYYSNMVAAVG